MLNTLLVTLFLATFALTAPSAGFAQAVASPSTGPTRGARAVSTEVPVTAQTGTKPRGPHRVRSVDSDATDALQRGLAGSSWFRRLVAALEHSDVIVHIETTVDLPGGMDGATRLVTTSAGTRYLRVSINRHLSPDVRAAMLAHELQHVREIARSGASNTSGIRRLYERIGVCVHSDGRYFETQRAIAIGRLALFELRDHGRRVDASASN